MHDTGNYAKAENESFAVECTEQWTGMFDQRGQFHVFRQINHLSILCCAVTMHNTINKRNLSLTLRSLMRYAIVIIV